MFTAIIENEGNTLRLYTFCITIQNTLMHDLAGLFANNAAVGAGLGQVAMNALNPMAGAVSIFNLLAIIALGYCVITIAMAVSDSRKAG